VERSESACELVLDAWPELAVEVRSAAIEQLLAESAGSGALLQRLSDGRIGATDLDLTQRDRLLHHSDQQLSALARSIFVTSASADRGAVVASYAPVTQLTGHAERGRLLFERHCANCHAPTNGSALGPNLKSLTDRSTSALLASILDPSRAVEPKYVAYQAELASGEVVYGMIVAESGRSLQLRPLTGPARELLRDEIEHLENTRRSFMPDGLEAELSAQDLADVIRYVQQ
jgi:putative heme-binding domain-containing protein